MARTTLLGLLVLAFAAGVAGQDAPAPAPEPAPPPEAAPDLHKIYVPYDKLDDVFGTDKERVLVPYQEFLELWKLKYGPKQRGDKPPVPFTVESAVYDGRVQDGVAAFTAALEIEVFTADWHRIPLAFTGVAFEEVLVDGEPAVIVPAKKGYDLILKGTGRRKITARFVAGIAQGKEHATVAFGLPSVPLHRLTFRVPGPNTEIGIEPARAHTVANDDGETKLLAFLGPQSTAKLTWRSRPVEADREPPLLFSTDLLDVRVEERVLRGRAQFDLEILRTPAREFVVQIPEGVQVIEVTGGKIKTWGFADEARRRLRVQLHEEVLGRYTLAVGFEGPLTVPGPLTAPAFRVENTSRERGFVRVRSAEGVGVRPVSLENVFQADLNALPKPIRGGERALGFRFPNLPYALHLRTERIAPRVTLRSYARAEVERRTVKLTQHLAFQVERAGIFHVEIEVPPGLVLTDIGTPDLVDGWRETETADGVRLLTIDLKGRRLGAFALPLKGIAPLDLAAEKLAVPLLRVRGVDREEGTLGVFMDPGLKAVADVANAVPLEPAQFRREDAFASPLPLAFAWRWRGAGARVTFDIETRKPKISCDVRYALHAEESRVRVQAELAYDVQFTGVDTFRFRVPKSISADLKIDGRNVREKKPVDDPVEESRIPTVTWTVTLQGPALGAVRLTAEWDLPFPAALKVNESRDALVQALTPLDVERANTYVAIRKSPVIKVEPVTDEYEQIDGTELPKELQGDDVFLALRRFEPPAPFRLAVEKHEYQPVADLVVRHTHLETVVAEEDLATTTAYFEILNNDRQFLALRLPEGHKVLELFVAGKPEKPRVGDGKVLLVPLLTGLRKDATFQVAIAYTHPIETSGLLFRETAFRGPELPAYEDAAPPFQALLTWNVHTPEDWRVTGFDGNVVPAGADARRGSWLARAIGALGRLVQPATGPDARAESDALPLHRFEEIVPMYKQRESVQTLFTNGTGDGAVAIGHTYLATRVVLLLLAAAAGAWAVVVLARHAPPLRAGGAAVLAALVLLAFAGRFWAPLWNAFAAAALVTTIALRLARGREVRS